MLCCKIDKRKNTSYLSNNCKYDVFYNYVKILNLMTLGVGATLIVVNNLMPVLMGIFTGWFEKWYPARLARGSKKQ